jgi:hypothetical protein
LQSFEELMAQNIPDELFKKPNTPIVTVGGFINFTGAARSQSDAYNADRLPDAILQDNRQPNPELAGTHNRFSKSSSFANDSEIYIKVGAISDSGLKYGAIIELEADTTTDAFNEGFNADKSFVFTESRIGKFEFGNNNGVNQKMKVGPASFARATGGINGKYLQHINLPMLAHSSQLQAGSQAACSGGVGVKADGTVENNADLSTACTNIKLPRFILIPQSPVAHGGYAKGFYNRTNDNDYKIDANGNLTNNDGSFNRNTIPSALYGYKDGSFGQMEDATKISYYTPRVSGWQAGISFTPDSGDSGTASSISGSDSGDIENIISWGLNYTTNINNLGIAFSATGENGAFENSNIRNSGVNQINRNNLGSYDAGFMLTYFGFTIGGSFGTWGDSLQPGSGIYSCDYDNTVDLEMQTCNRDDQKIKKFDDATYYTAGLAYEFGPFATSLTHISSEFQRNEYQATSIGIDYKLAKGFLPYFELTRFAFKSNQPNFLGANNSSNENSQQLKDNEGFVGLLGVLFSF